MQLSLHLKPIDVVSIFKIDTRKAIDYVNESSKKRMIGVYIDHVLCIEP